MQGKWVTIAQFAVPKTVVRVGLDQTWQVDYWARQFGCTPYELREAVKTVGIVHTNVRAYLKKKGWHKLECDGSVCFASPIAADIRRSQGRPRDSSQGGE
jgi:hypothetical protein